jgi:hypothetical protein
MHRRTLTSGDHNVVHHVCASAAFPSLPGRAHGRPAANGYIRGKERRWKMSAEKMLSGGRDERRRLCILGGAEVGFAGDARVRERNIALLDATVGVLAPSNYRNIEDGYGHQREWLRTPSVSSSYVRHRSSYSAASSATSIPSAVPDGISSSLDFELAKG